MAAKTYRPNSSRIVLLGGRGKFGNPHDFEDFAVTKDFIALLIKVTNNTIQYNTMFFILRG